MQFQIVCRLVEEAGIGGHIAALTAEPMVDGDLKSKVLDRFPDLLERHDSDPGWKVFKSHSCSPSMSALFAAGQAVGVYSFRDLRDAVVSAARMRQAPRLLSERWRLERFVETTLESCRAWTRLPRVLETKYEEMVLDLPGEVQRIAGHLGLSPGRETCERIASDLTLEKQRRRTEESRKKWPSSGAFFDPDTLLHTEHIGTGEIGGWRRALTPGQVAVIEERGGGWLLERGYELSLGPLRRRWLLLSSRPREVARSLRRLTGGTA